MNVEIEEDFDTFTEEELLMKHKRGLEAIRAGYGITKTMAELEEMAHESGEYENQGLHL